VHIEPNITANVTEPLPAVEEDLDESFKFDWLQWAPLMAIVVVFCILGCIIFCIGCKYCGWKCQLESRQKVVEKVRSRDDEDNDLSQARLRNQDQTVINIDDEPKVQAVLEEKGMQTDMLSEKTVDVVNQTKKIESELGDRSTKTELTAFRTEKSAPDVMPRPMNFNKKRSRIVVESYEDPEVGKQIENLEKESSTVGLADSTER